MSIPQLGDDDYRIRIETPQDVHDALDLIHSLALDELGEDSGVVEVVGRAIDELLRAGLELEEDRP